MLIGRKYNLIERIPYHIQKIIELEGEDEYKEGTER